VSYIRGDFTRYFLASPTERSALEQSSLVARQTADANFVSASSLLSKPAVQAAFAEVIDSSRVANVRLRTTGDADLALQHTGGSAVVPPEATDATPVQRELTVFAEGSGTQARAAEVSIAKETSAANVDVNRTAGADFVVFSPTPHADTAVPAQAVSALSLALSRLVDPFVQTVSDLQGGVATFSDIVAVQVVSQMRTDGRPALLVDTRNNARQREMNDITVVSI
jgi:hypothetical protein